MQTEKTGLPDGPTTTYKKGQRLYCLELLRLISMMMVVVLHFLGKSGILPTMKEPLDSVGITAIVLESFAAVAVNLYMLLTGYFLPGMKFKPAKLLQLLLQIWFYTIGVGLVAGAFGLLPEEGFTIHYILMLVFPVSMEHYWFMTAYVFFYLFVPLLSIGVRKLTKKQLGTVIVCLLIMFSLIKSVLPVVFETDHKGYDVIWYVVVSLCAAYISMYGSEWKKLFKIAPFFWLGATALLTGVLFVLHAIYMKTGRLEEVLTYCYHYNHILLLTAAVGLFLMFTQIEIPEKIGKIICVISPCTLGVYLLHEHLAVRYEWQKWILQLTGDVKNPIELVGITLLTVLLVFSAGIGADAVRRLLFGLAHKILGHIPPYKKLCNWLEGLGIR